MDDLIDIDTFMNMFVYIDLIKLLAMNMSIKENEGRGESVKKKCLDFQEKAKSSRRLQEVGLSIVCFFKMSTRAEVVQHTRNVTVLPEHKFAGHGRKRFRSY